jgi:hypothetical protein
MKNTITLFLALIAFSQSVVAQTTCVVNVNQNSVINPNSKKLLGISFDARTSEDVNSGPSVVAGGYYDPTTGLIIPEVQPLWDRVPMHGVRYPGNPVIYNWNWSYTIGPVGNRIAQNLGSGIPVQSLVFGFDEFMDMCAVKGLAYSDVQIMVNIYPSTGQNDPAILAADWVEYCNAPADGSNPRGGTDWAALRAQYGHQLPYNVKIWNIGNEPWTSGELGSTTTGATNYVNIASPIIDSMLSADPTIHITIPSVGNSASQWNSTILSSSLMGRIYGLSPHSFYDDDASTNNPTIAQAQSLLINLTTAASAQGLKIVLGDQATHAQNADPDRAMQWHGALTTADYLMMASQLNNVELANFWIYGNPKAVWHPIRQDVNTGEYTLMAAAQLYETFSPVFLDQSLSTTTTDNLGNPVTKVRSGGFVSSDGMNASVIVVNTDTINDNEVVVPVLSGFTLQSTRMIYGDSLVADTSKTIPVIPVLNGNYSLPKATVLLFEYAADISTSVESSEELALLYPNPSSGIFNFQLTNFNAFEKYFIKVSDVSGRSVLAETLSKERGTVNLSNQSAGIYFLKIETENGLLLTKKLMLQK